MLGYFFFGHGYGICNIFVYLCRASCIHYLTGLHFNARAMGVSKRKDFKKKFN